MSPQLLSLRSSLTEADLAVLRQADESFMKNGPLLIFSNLTLPEPSDGRFAYNLFYRLGQFGLCNCDSQAKCVLNSSFSAFMYEINNPPPVNHWESLLQWWYSKRWAVLLVVAFAILGISQKAIEFIQTIRAWVLVSPETIEGQLHNRPSSKDVKTTGM